MEGGKVERRILSIKPVGNKMVGYDANAYINLSIQFYVNLIQTS